MPEEKPNIEELRAQYTEIFLAKLKKDRMFEEFLRIGRRNSEGQLWIAGGFVYRPIIEELYKIKTARNGNVVDVDFFADRLSREPYTPTGWKQRRTAYATPYLLKDKKYRVDLNDLPNFRSIVVRKLEPTMENFLAGTPLDIQSIAWRCDEEAGNQLIIGDAGILAIHNREVRTHNLEEVEYEAKRREITLLEFVALKAGQLRFDLVKEDVHKLKSYSTTESERGLSPSEPKKDSSLSRIFHRLLPGKKVS